MNPEPDRPRLVLLGLRLVGFGSAEDVGATVDVPAPVVAEVLGDLGRRRWASHHQSPRPAWRLTPEGRAEGERRLAVELEERGARRAVHAAYERFLAWNVEALGTCTAWQVREGNVLNDHGDEAYDAVVIDRLVALHDAIRPVCTALAGALDRFGRYEQRLGHALERVQRGEGEWFTGATVASYHSVWFELHENLLATLGIDRSAEPRPDPSLVQPPTRHPPD